MSEDAQKILDYLPLRVNVLDNEYIKYLWNTFCILELSDDSSRSFSIIPFHLLFMMVLQYKIIRISTESQYEYNLAFTIKNSRNGEKILKPDSVFDISTLPERTMPDLLRIVGIKEHIIDEVKNLIDNRNNLAHVKGVLEEDVDSKINKYLRVLNSIQVGSSSINDAIGNIWSNDFTDDYEVSEFVESRLLDSVLCREDFSSGILKQKFGAYIDSI